VIDLLRSPALTNRARVCMCVGLFRGVDSATIATVLGLCSRVVSRTLTSLVRSGVLTRHRVLVHGANGSRSTIAVRYHETKEAKKLVRAELRRIRSEGVNLVDELRQHPRIKLEKLDRLLGILPDDQC